MESLFGSNATSDCEQIVDIGPKLTSDSLIEGLGAWASVVAEGKPDEIVVRVWLNASDVRSRQPRRRVKRARQGR
jgi:hypothetical protein